MTETILVTNKELCAGNLPTYFANIICSPDNQHAMVKVLGASGTGKSWAAIILAIETSKEVARIMGGKPEDYFNVKEHLATIGKEDIKRIMTNPKKCTILLLDDVAISYNARKFQDEFNIFINDLLQSFRPNHNLVIMTMQSDFLIDKVGRVLAHYTIIMDQAYFSLGITTAKVFKNVIQHLKKGEVYQQFLVEKNIKYVRHIFSAPDKDITNFYEEERARQLKKLKDDKDKEQEVKISMKANYPVMKRMFDSGITKTAISKFFGVSKQYIGDIFKSNKESEA